MVSSYDWWWVMIFFNTLPRRMWTLSRDDVATKPRHDIQSKKFMFTIIWNPRGFYIVDRLPNDTKMNSVYFITIYLFHSNKWSFLDEGRRMKYDSWFISTIALFTQVGFQQIGLKNTVFSACHTHHIHLIWPTVTSTSFLQSKKIRTDSVCWRGPVFKCLQDILRGLDQQELNGVFQA
jgi:hypothetical protein